jgi:hypothetical protein
MTTAQIESRQERAHKGVLIASRVEGGFRVYSTDNPSQQYSVAWDGERLTCTCPDFEFHQADPGWRCKHIMAVEPFDNNLPELPEPAEDVAEHDDAPAAPAGAASSGEPPESAPPRKRRAPKEPPSPTHMIIKRSVSPDGRIDSVSVEFSTPVLDLQVGEIKERALKTLQLQREIVASFLKLNGHVGQPAASPQPTPIERNGDGLPVLARMLDVGKVNGKWGDRLCIVFDMNGNRTRLFGSPKQLAEHIGAAGYRIRPDEITAGLRLNLPCQVVTKPSDDGKYVNIERVFAVERQPTNGGSNASRVH